MNSDDQTYRYSESLYSCVFSGKSPTENQSDVDDDDEIGDLPLGWMRIALQHRAPNPKWSLIQHIKSAAVTQIISDMEIPEGDLEEIRPAIEIQIEAQYAILEERTPKYIITEEVVCVSDPTHDDQVKKALKNLYEMLDLDFSMVDEKSKNLAKP